MVDLDKMLELAGVLQASFTADEQLCDVRVRYPDDLRPCIGVFDPTTNARHAIAFEDEAEFEAAIKDGLVFDRLSSKLRTVRLDVNNANG